MFNYLAFVHHGIEEASGDASADGRKLASECFAQLMSLDNSEQFPPRLMILLASPEYLEPQRAQSLLNGVHDVSEEFGHGEVALIGSTVSAVFFNRRIHSRGALLICLASRLMEAEVSFGENARFAPENAVEDLLDRLKLNFTCPGTDPNPLINRMLFTFFPGFGDAETARIYPGPELHTILRAKTRARVPITGGGASAGSGSSADAPAHTGLQFAGRQVYRDAIVAAKLTTGVPFTSSIGHGLTPTGHIYRVEELGEDRQTILRFMEGLPTEILGLTNGAGDFQPQNSSPEPLRKFRLLGELSLNDDPLITVARAVHENPGAVRMLRKLRRNLSLELLEPEPERMRQEAVRLVEQSIRRMRIENPVGLIGLHCASWRIHGPEIGMLIDDVRQKTNIFEENYVGGFFDGEIGASQTGDSLFGNWCVSTVCFGDEMRQRTPFYSGFDAMAKLSQKLAEVNSLEEAIEYSLELLYQVGYPGAMLSSLMLNEDGKWLIPTHAKGSRYETIVNERVDEARREVSNDDLFALIARGEASPLVMDTQAYSGKEFAAYKDLRIVSQYIKPIKNFKGTSLAFLQIDLGDMRYKKHLQEEELRVIDSLCIVVEATLTRLFNRIEAQFARDLDAALFECLESGGLHDALQLYIEKAISIFGTSMGHIRLARHEDRKLVMVAGKGEFFDAQRQSNSHLSMDDESPTSHAFKNFDSQKHRALVVNDVTGNKPFLNLFSVLSHFPQSVKALEKVRSYANFVFEDGRGNPIGTINLLSESRWFFTRPLVNSLKAMGQRISILIQHHKRQNHQRFLSEVSKVYEDTEGFKTPLDTLRDATKRCREAANADIACLFLWDQEIRKFVLYAQDGWDERWVKAASFGEQDRWIGRIALDEGPLYIPDVYSFKLKRGTANLTRYSRSMFGEYFSESCPVEALVLPLRLKLKDWGMGVFTLYRKVNPDKLATGESFTVTDRVVLEEAAKNLTVMVSGQLRREDFLSREKDRRLCDRIRNVMTNAQKSRGLEATLCQEMMEQLKASQVRFFQAGNLRDAELLVWNTGLDFMNKSLSPENADELALRAAQEREPLSEKVAGTPYSDLDPELARREGRLKRVCLPLISRKRLLGVMDIRWDEKHLAERRAISRQTGREIADAYYQQVKSVASREVKRQARRNRLAAQTMGVMLFQSTHRVMNLVQELRAMPRLIAAASSNEERAKRLSQLAELINSATDRIQQPMEIAKRTRIIEPTRCNLSNLISRVMDDVPCLSPVDINVTVDNTIQVWVDPHLIEEAFVNIIQNAFKAMPDGGKLEIQATMRESRKTALVIFTDTGIGMTEEEVYAVMRGFKSKQSTGMGVLAALLMVTANNGKLRIKSHPGQGTQVIVTLPVETS